MNPVKTIEFQGVSYNLYEISPKQLNGQIILVGDDDLNLAIEDALDIPDDRSEIKREAIRIDQDIYCFMPEFILDDTEDKVLAYFDEYFD